MSWNKPNNSVILILVVCKWANSPNISLLNLGLNTYSSFCVTVRWKTIGIDIMIIIYIQEVFQYFVTSANLMRKLVSISAFLYTLCALQKEVIIKCPWSAKIRKAVPKVQDHRLENNLHLKIPSKGRCLLSRKCQSNFVTTRERENIKLERSQGQDQLFWYNWKLMFFYFMTKEVGFQGHLYFHGPKIN